MSSVANLLKSNSVESKYESPFELKLSDGVDEHVKGVASLDFERGLK